jgi:hypothetical protein
MTTTTTTAEPVEAQETVTIQNPKRATSEMISQWGVLLAILACIPSLYCLNSREFIPLGRHSRMIGGPEISTVVLALAAVSLLLGIIGMCLRGKYSFNYFLMGVTINAFALYVLFESFVGTA